MRLLLFLGWIALLMGALSLAFAGCAAPTPVSVDAPQLASSLRWVGVCAVVCSALGAAALIIASNRRK